MGVCPFCQLPPNKTRGNSWTVGVLHWKLESIWDGEVLEQTCQGSGGVQNPFYLRMVVALG